MLFGVEDNLLRLLQNKNVSFEKSSGASPKIILGRENKKISRLLPKKMGGGVGKKMGCWGRGCKRWKQYQQKGLERAYRRF